MTMMMLCEPCDGSSCPY